MGITEKNNAASRSRWVLLNALHQGDGVTTLSAWDEVILGGSGEAIEDFEVIRLVEALRSEIQLAERQLASAGVPESTFKPHFQKAYQATDLKNVNAPWQHYKQYITPEVLLCFSFATHIIPEDEPEFDEEQISEIEKLITDLKESLESTEVDAALRHFVEQQIRLLERGIHDLRIRGSKALKKCYVEGLGEIVENSHTIQEHSNSPIIEKLRKAWHGLQAATEKASEMNKSLETWAKLIEKGSDLIDGFSKLT